MTAHTPTVAIFGPDPLLSIAIENRGAGEEIHLHAGGQGVWVARMARELGARPILCAFLGGESGAVLAPLLDGLAVEQRLITTASANGTYVVDRRGSERRVLACALREAPHRHEIDDLVAAACAAALRSDVLVLCNPFPAGDLPEEVYDTIAADVRAAGVPMIVDLSSPRLERTLAHRPDLVKLNDWELAELIKGPVDGERGLRAMRGLLDRGARAVALTRAEAPIAVLEDTGEGFEVVPPSFPRGFREGCGDAMTGAVAAAWARGLSLREAIRLGAAAGAGNFLRHGLGTGQRQTIEELQARVVVRPLAGAAPRTAA